MASCSSRPVLGFTLLLAAVATLLLRDAHRVRVDALQAVVRAAPHSLLGPAAVFAAYVAALAVLGPALPGWVYPGTLLADGRTRLYYKCNGFLILTLCVTLFLGAYAVVGAAPAVYAADRSWALFLVANAAALVLAALLLAKHRLLSAGGVEASANRPRFSSPLSLLRDFVLGAELNPRLLGTELKFFWLRPSMIGWQLLNLSLAVKQLETYGFITDRMLLYQLLTGAYILDYFWYEPKMTSTWDIIAERFGLMLIWGDIVFISFAFSLQARFLLHDVRPLPAWQAAATLATTVSGAVLFRGANSQKHAFKRQPRRAARPVRTFANGRLLASGFWGVARHINYTGDLLLALAFCLPCGDGPGGALAFFYFFYLLLLLVHRAGRDEQRCAAKYGDAWREYCAAVPYRMVPGLY